MVALLRNHHVCSSQSNHTQNHTHAGLQHLDKSFENDKEIGSDSPSKRAHYHDECNFEAERRIPFVNRDNLICFKPPPATNSL